MLTEVELNGVVQDNETYSAISYKGNHNPFKLSASRPQTGWQTRKQRLPNFVRHTLYLVKLADMDNHLTISV